MAVWTVVVALIADLVFVGGTWIGIYDAPIRLSSLALTAAALLGWAVAMARRPTWRPRSVLWPPAVLCLAVFTLCSATSRVLRVSVEYLAWAVLLAALYLLLVSLLRDSFYRGRVLRLTGPLGAAVCAAYVAVNVADWIDWWGLVGKLAAPPLRPAFESLTYGNPSTVLTVAVLLAAPAFALMDRGRAAHRLAAAALAGLLIATALISGSRASWLALAAAAVGTLLVATATSSLLPGARRAIQRRRTALVGVGLVVVVLAGTGVAAPGLASRFGAGGLDYRTSYYLSAVRVFQDSPLVGTGPGTWVVERASHTAADEIDYEIPHAHDVYLQTLAEFGLAGLVAGIAVAVSLLRLIASAIRSGERDRISMGYAALFGSLYFALQQVLDFDMNVPAALFAFALPIAYLDATAPHRDLARFQAPPWTRAAAAGAVVAVGAATAGLLRAETIALQMDGAVTAANEGDWQTDALYARRVVAEDPDVGAYQFTLGLALAQTGDHAGAIAALTDVAALDGLAEAWLDVAAEKVQIGDLSGARADLANALRLGVQRPAVAVPAGQLALELDDRPTAVQAFAAAIAATPSLAADPWWTAEPDRRDAFGEALQHVIASAPSPAWFICLQAGLFDQATAYAQQLGAGGRSDALTVIAAWRGDPSAWQTLVARAQQEPISGLAAQIALVADHLGLASERERFARWADIINAGTDPYAHALRVAPPGSSVPVAGGAAEFYGHFTYRRPTPWDLLVPSLPHAVIQ